MTMKKMLAGLLFVLSLSIPAGAQNKTSRYDSDAVGYVSYSLNSGSPTYYGQIQSSTQTVGKWGLGCGVDRINNGFTALDWDCSASHLVTIPNLSVGNLTITGSIINPVPSLGLAGNYAALSAADGGAGAVTCTNSTINGDIGSSGGGGSVTQTVCTLNGSVVAPVSAQTVADFDTAYGRFSARQCDQILTGTLAGITLTPGTYCFSADASLTGVLTLNGPANGVWVFKTGTSLAATNFTVAMAGGAIPCNVHWITGTSFAATTSTFNGNVLAGTSLTSTGAGGLFKGHALAKAGVTFTTTIANTCP